MRLISLVFGLAYHNARRVTVPELTDAELNTLRAVSASAEPAEEAGAED